VLSAQKARQGVLGRRVLIILAVSMVLAVIYLIASLLWAGILNRQEPAPQGLAPAEKLAMQATVPASFGIGTSISRNRVCDFDDHPPPASQKVTHAVQKHIG
jgi:hypothetical protein